MEEIELHGIKEYCENYPVYLYQNGDPLTLHAWNEGHYNSTMIDLQDVLKYFGYEWTDEEIMKYVKEKEHL